MNAYELADDVKNISNTIEALEWVQKATPLLRQQADRIKELEDRLSMYEIKDLDKPQIKELSDEEILELADKHLIIETEYIGMGDYVDTVKGEIQFARAILKKANEK